MKGLTEFLINHINTRVGEKVLFLESPGSGFLHLVYAYGRERRIVLKAMDQQDGRDVKEVLDTCVFNNLLLGVSMDDETMQKTGRCLIHNVVEFLEKELDIDLMV